MNARSLLVWSLAPLFAFGVVTVSHAEPSPSPEPLRFGAMADLTGPFSANGEECRRGWEVALHEFAPDGTIGGRRVDFVYGDTQGDARTGITEFQRLTEVERVLAVLTTRSQVAMPLDPLSLKAEVPLLATVAHPDFVTQNPYAFRFWPNAKGIGEGSAQWMAEHGIHRVSAITLEDEFTMSLIHAFFAAGGPLGITPAGQDTVQAGEIDFAPVVSRIRAAHPDLVFVNLGLPQIGPCIRRLREQGITVPIITNTFAAYKEVVDGAGAANIEGTRYLDFAFDTPSYLNRYRAQFPDRRPVGISYCCYGALGFLLQTVQSNSAITTRAQLFDGLKRLTEAHLGDDRITIIGREAQIPPVRRIFRNGQPVAETP